MRLAESLMKSFRAFACIGIGAWFLTIAIETSCAQQQISSMASVADVEVTDTMTVGGGEVIASVEVDNEDIVDVDYVAAQAFLYVGGTGPGSVGVVDYDFSSATSTATTSLTAGQTYDLQGMAGECYYGSGGGGDDDDDDDDDDDHGVLFVPAVDAPQFSEPPAGENCNEEWLGYLPLTLQTGVPSITSISPNTGTVGDSNKTISVTGENLEDELGVTGVLISGSGVTSSVSSPGTSSATVTYSVSTGTSTSTGARQFTMSNSFGTSNAETFTIVDPTPTVTGVSPSTWNAGSSYTVTITGTNFGTNPSVSIALPTGTIQPTTSNLSDTSVTVSFTVPGNCPSGEAPVTVTSTGFTGNGFYNGNTGNTASATNNSGETVFNPPQPTINLLNGMTNSPLAGQAISLSVSPPANSGLTIAAWAWTITNQADAVAGYTVTYSNGNPVSGCYSPVAPSSGPGVCTGPSFITTQANIGPFYFIVPGQSESVTVTVMYNLADGSTSSASPPATQTFNVGGATGVTITPTLGQQEIFTSGTPPTLTLGGAQVEPGTFAGIEFQAVSSQPSSVASGSYSWVQLVTKDTDFFVDSGGRFQCPGIPGNPELDNVYPYGSGHSGVLFSTNGVPNDTATDTPRSGLPDGEDARSFGALIYLMWTPQAGSSCSGSNCTLPIPLDSVAWSWSWDAINTLTTQHSPSNSTTFVLNTCSSESSGGCVVSNPKTDPNQSYPTWQAVSLNDAEEECTTY